MEIWHLKLGTDGDFMAALAYEKQQQQITIEVLPQRSLSRSRTADTAFTHYA